MISIDELPINNGAINIFMEDPERRPTNSILIDAVRFYHDLKHVRLVPLKDVMAKLRSSNVNDKNRAHNLVYFKQFQKTFGSYEERGSLPLLGSINLTAEENEANQHVRKIIKQHWLVHNLQENELNDPPLCVIQGANDNLSATFHPGGMRTNACDMLDLNPNCVVYDLFYHFTEYPKLELEDILELYGQPRCVSADIHRHLLFGIPDMANHHPDSILQRSDEIWSDWCRKSIHMWDKPLKIFIGYDSRHGDMSDVCAASIINYIEAREWENPDNIDMFELIKIDVSQIPEYDREYKNQSTEFTYSRFLVPYLSNYEGISIFVDDDFIFKNSILDLFFFVHHDSPVACVKHEYSESAQTKMNGDKNVWYPKKLWSSLMVFNNSHPDCKALTPEVVNNATPEYLHQFEWASKVDSIPKKYVWTEGYDPIENIRSSASLHFTHGGPWVPGQDCSNIEGLSYYYRARLGGRDNFKDREVVALDFREYTIEVEDDPA